MAVLKPGTYSIGSNRHLHCMSLVASQEICEAYEEMQRKLSSVSKTGEEVVALKKFYR